MKNPRLNGHNRTMPDHVASSSRTENFYSFESTRSVRMKKRKKERPSSRAPFSQVYEIRGIQFGGEFALNGHGTRLTPDPSRVSTHSAGMCLGARREINLNPRTRKAPALTRTSATPATHPFLSLSRLVYWKSCVKIGRKVKLV